jgi:hypothetical protein
LLWNGGSDATYPDIIADIYTKLKVLYGS